MSFILRFFKQLSTNFPTRFPLVHSVGIKICPKRGRDVWPSPPFTRPPVQPSSVHPSVRPTSRSVYLSLRQTSPSAIHPIIQFDTTDPSTIKTEKKQNSHNFVPFQSLLVVGTRPPKTARLTSLTIRDWLGLPPQQQQPQEQQQQHHLRGVAQKRHGSVSIFLLPRFSGC